MQNVLVNGGENISNMCQARFIDSPLDGKPRDSGFLCQDISSYSFDDRFRRGVCVEFFAIVLVIDVVSDSDKFAFVVRTGEKNDSHPKNFGGG